MDEDPYRPRYILSFRRGGIRLEVVDFLFLLYQVVMIVLFGIFVVYPDYSAPGSFPSLSKEQAIFNDYSAYRDIAVMVYVSAHGMIGRLHVLNDTHVCVCVDWLWILDDVFEA